MESNVWQNELKEIISFKASYEIESQKVLKELECLVDAQNDEVALLYTRRTLEVIVTELCDDKWKKERGSEPLLSIIDRLHRDKFLPDFAHASMQNLNKIATFGVHPKEFDTNQVRTALLELVTVLKWYVKEKNYQKKEESKKVEEKITTDKIKESPKIIEKASKTEAQTPSSSSNKNNNKVLIYSIIIILLIIIILFIFKTLPDKGTADTVKDTLNKNYSSKALKLNADTAGKTAIKTTEINTQQPASKVPETHKASENKQVSLVKEEIKSRTNQNNSAKNENIESLFNKFSNGTSKEKKDAVAGILAQCDKNAIVSIMVDNNVMDQPHIDKYLEENFLNTKYLYTIKKKETNSNGKITNLYISKEKK